MSAQNTARKRKIAPVSELPLEVSHELELERETQRYVVYTRDVPELAKPQTIYVLKADLLGLRGVTEGAWPATVKVTISPA